MSVTLTRKELYDRVWAKPVDTLAKEYGLSNVGLGKACRRHGIPAPPRGYWARKAAGQNLRRPRLPTARDGRESVTLWGTGPPAPPPDEVERAVHPLIAFESEPQNKIRVPEDLRVRQVRHVPTSKELADAKRYSWMRPAPYGEARLVVAIPEAIVLPYEWIHESRSHRHFSVPAEVVNRHGRVSKEGED